MPTIHGKNSAGEARGRAVVLEQEAAKNPQAKEFTAERFTITVWCKS